ncbi:MAG: biotin-dependent carboxyltransferase family protein [Cellvibrionales bacterium]|nr:biotin-dependent carboxyltransferase family protein [Cellvibrionales bacterium]
MMIIGEAGLQTSIQDLGRLGLMDKGISRGGAMDTLSAFFANWLVGARPEQPVLEITMTGPTICFEESVTVAVTGAQFDLTLNGKSQAMNENFDVAAGDKLVFGRCHKGLRAYLAISADWDIPKVLDSSSTHLMAGFGGFKGRSLKSGDPIRLLNSRQIEYRVLDRKYHPGLTGDYLLRCVPCVETQYFPDAVLSDFTHRTFTVSPLSNRMGIRLSGDPLFTKNEPIEKSATIVQGHQLLSTGLMAGNIQLPPAGLPIIAGVDAQTIGGYPRIAHVIQADWPQIAQLRPQNSVRFVMVDEQKAREVYQGQQALLKELGRVYAARELSSSFQAYGSRGPI